MGVGSQTPGFNDLVVAQQNLAQAVGTYIATLGFLWQAVVDVADLLQTKDLFGAQTPTEAVPEIPDLEKLPVLPCRHPCSPVPDGHRTAVDADWPVAAPLPAEPRTDEPAETLPPPKPIPQAGVWEKATPAAGSAGVQLMPPTSLPRDGR